MNFLSDELCIILEYLQTSDIVNLSRISHDFYQKIEKIGKNKRPEVVYEPWTIRKAFSKNELIIQKSQDLETFKKKKNCIEKLKIFDFDDFDRFIKEIQIEKNDQDLDKYIQPPKKIQKKSSNIKKLSMAIDDHLNITWEELLQVLTPFQEIESLSISSNISILSKQSLVLEKCKKLKYFSGCEESNLSKILLKFLVLVPNIEKFTHYEYSNLIDLDILLRFKSLKSIHLVAFEDYKIEYKKFNDEKIAYLLNSMENLEEMILESFNNITGTFLNDLKENWKLKTLSILKDYYSKDDNAHLKNKLHCLKTLNLKGFNLKELWRDLEVMCPKIRYIFIDFISESKESYDEDYKNVCQYQPQNLIKLEIAEFSQRFRDEL